MAELAGSLLAPVITETVSQVSTGIREEFRLSENMEENHETLKEAIARLQARKNDCEMQVQRERTKTTTNVYNVWCSRVIKIMEEFNSFETKYNQDNKRSSKLRVSRRSRYSNKMTEMHNKVLNLEEQGAFPQGYLVDRLLDTVLKMNAPDIGKFPTLQTSLEKTLDLLGNDRLKGIALLGPVGVGKSSILKNLNNHVEVAKMFDLVIWVKVSIERREKKLRYNIAQRLRLSIDGSTHHDEVTTRMIFEELKGKKYLLLLDEVMESIDLNEIGIPENDNGSKVVLTTEFRHVCNSMVERVIEVRPLTPNEAWKMFQEIVIDIINLPDIKPLAQLVAKECSRLPLLIKTVAGSFKSKDSYSEWKIGLEELRKWPEVEIEDLTQLHAFLNFCYNQLKDEEKKRCFLYSALYPADSKMYTDYLVECWASMGFLGKINEKRRLQDARHKGFDILKHLTNVSLLEKGERMIYVQMNNNVRKVALAISSKDPNCQCLVETSEPTGDDWKQATMISLVDAKLCDDLPENPNCDSLLSLLLQKNSDLTMIPPSFFKKMTSLLVLDLSGTGIVSLPSSLSCLTVLKGLYLNGCIHLTELFPTEVDLQLEILDIRGCKVEFLPIHIRNFLKLRCLRVSYYKRSPVTGSQDMEVDGGVISRLSRLEELIIDIDVLSYDQWCNEVSNIIREVAALEKLCSFRVCIPKSQALKAFMEHSRSWRDSQINSFRFFVGCQTQKRPRILEYFQYKINRYLRYSNGDNENDPAVCDVLVETEAFELTGHKQIGTLSDFSGIASLNRVRGCHVERCCNIQSIVDGNKTGGGDILPNLEQLHLCHLEKIKSIFDGTMSFRSLCRLQTLVVNHCPMLTKLFSNGMIQQLSGLQYLAVSDCHEIEELIKVLEPEWSVLPNLKTLKLHHLPKLRALCDLKSLAWPSLKLLEIFRCRNLKALPFNKDNAPKLKSINGEQGWWDELQWQEAEFKDQLLFVASG